MFITPILSNIENVGFVVLLSLKTAVSVSWYWFQHLQKSVLNNYHSVFFFSFLNKTMPCLKYDSTHDHFANASPVNRSIFFRDYNSYWASVVIGFDSVLCPCRLYGLNAFKSLAVSFDHALAPEYLLWLNVAIVFGLHI